MNQLPEDWTILQFTCVEEETDQLIVTRLQPNQEACSKLCNGFSETVISRISFEERVCAVKEVIHCHFMLLFQGLTLMGEFDVLMQDSIDAMSLPTRKDWWETRFRLNEGIADWAERCRTQWFSPTLLSWMLSGSGPVILVLDRRLNSLPFELILQKETNRIFTRMTNLAVILAHYCQVREVVEQGIDLKKAFYVLNPDNDLRGTQSNMQPVFDSFGWTGLVGQQPKEEDLLKALRKYDLLA